MSVLTLPTAEAQGLITDYGESVVVRTWSDGAVDAETGLPATTGATASVTAVRREPRDLQTLPGPEGQDVTVDMYWYFKDGEQPVHTAGDRMPRIEPAVGGVFTVLKIGRTAQLGVRQVACQRLR